jgi:hypothetical protein
VRLAWDQSASLWTFSDDVTINELGCFDSATAPSDSQEKTQVTAELSQADQALSEALKRQRS